MRDFCRFWTKAIWDSLSFGWLILGVVATALPDGLPVAHKLIPMIASVELIQWIEGHPTRAHLLAAACAVIVYLFYAPYRLYKNVENNLVKALEDLNTERDARIDGVVAKYLKTACELKLYYGIRVLQTSGVALLKSESELEDVISRIWANGLTTPLQDNVMELVPKGKILEFFKVAHKTTTKLINPIETLMFRDKVFEGHLRLKLKPEEWPTPPSSIPDKGASSSGPAS